MFSVYELFIASPRKLTYCRDARMAFFGAPVRFVKIRGVPDGGGGYGVGLSAAAGAKWPRQGSAAL